MSKQFQRNVQSRGDYRQTLTGLQTFGQGEHRGSGSDQYGIIRLDQFGGRGPDPHLFRRLEFLLFVYRTVGRIRIVNRGAAMGPEEQVFVFKKLKVLPDRYRSHLQYRAQSEYIHVPFFLDLIDYRLVSLCDIGHAQMYTFWVFSR